MFDFETFRQGPTGNEIDCPWTVFFQFVLPSSTKVCIRSQL